MSERESEGLLDKEELDELRSAMAALRKQIERARTGTDLGSALGELGRRARQRLGHLDLLELAGDLGRRVRPLLARSSAPEVDEFGLDSAALASVREWLDFVLESWWRVEVSGLEQVPSDTRVLFVANRSGVLPYDGLVICHLLERELGVPRPRFLVADWLTQLPFAQSWLARVGGVRACTENAEGLLRRDLWVVAFPEGQKGALKLFHDRYRLQRFARGGFVSIALRENAAIVPVGLVGAEEVHPVLYQSQFATRVLGLPALVTPTFPWFGPLGLVPLPSRWRIRFGQPVRLDGVDPARADDPLFVNRTTEQVRSAIQGLLDAEVRKRPSVF